jgi:pimeloyl-ACP methyl ester carboxylesterase
MSPLTAEHLLRLPDGRQLAWSESGHPDGSAVLLLHGSPGCRLGRQTELEQLAAEGIRQITYDRPGYGLSDPQPGRTVADAVSDVEVLLDAAGVERTGVIGGSGGGPHALALATLLPDRCGLVQCVVGVAPYGLPDLDFFVGMDLANQRRFAMATGARDEVLQAFTEEVARLAAQRTEDPASVMGDMHLPESDREILRQTADETMVVLAEAFRQGVAGFADDFAALARDWGFDPRGATAPVVISYGEHDVNVPAGHGRWLAANVPNVEVRVTSDAGHLMTPEAGFALLVETAAYEVRA